MSRTYTPRLGLAKESPDELVDQFYYNWPIVDQFVGGIVVANGFTPPNSQLFHGAIVCEATSGKVWIAKKLASGSYEKQWLAYPWQCAVSGNVVTNASVGGSAAVSLGTLVTSQCVNSSAVNQVSGGIRLSSELSGIYQITLSGKFNTNGTGGTRSIFISTNDNNDFVPNNAVREDSGAAYTMLNSVLIAAFPANSVVTAKIWQNSSGLMNTDMSMVATMISPY